MKPHCYADHPEAIAVALQRIQQAGLTVARLQLTQLTREDAENFYEEHRGKPFFEALLQMMTSGPSLFMEIVGQNSVKTWRQIIGATDPAKAEATSLRAKYGVDATRNAFHGSASPEEANNEIRKVFALRPMCAPEGTPTSVIVIEPTFKAQYPDILKELFYEISKRQDIHISGIHTCDPVAADIDELFKAY